MADVASQRRGKAEEACGAIGSLTLSDLRNFTYKLQVLQVSGLSLVDGLRILSTSGMARVSQVSDMLLTRVSRGSRFSDALGSCPKAFDPIYVCAVRCGEETGQLAEILKALHFRLERRIELRNRLGHAFSYPLVVFSVCLIMLIGLVYGLLPGFTKTLIGFGSSLPWPTKLLLSVSDPRILLVGTGVVLSCLATLVVQWKHNMEVRSFLNRVKFQVPLVGQALEDLVTAEFARTFSLLLEAGVPLLRALRLQIGNTGSESLDASLTEIYSSLRDGESLESALVESKLPGLLSQTMATAHEAAALPEMLKHVSQMLSERGGARLSTAVSIAEPLTMAVMGIVVGFVIIAAFLPLIGLIQKL